MTSPCFDIHKGQQRQQETERACSGRNRVGQAGRQAGSNRNKPGQAKWKEHSHKRSRLLLYRLVVTWQWWMADHHRGRTQKHRRFLHRNDESINKSFMSIVRPNLMGRFDRYSKRRILHSKKKSGKNRETSYTFKLHSAEHLSFSFWRNFSLQIQNWKFEFTFEK